MNIDKVCRLIGRTLNDDPELVKQIVMHLFLFVVDVMKDKDDTRDVLINKLFRFKLKNRFKDNKNKPLSPYEKIINIDRKPIMVDTDTAEVYAINRSARGIDDVYIIPEDANFEWTSKMFPDKTICEDVKKDDILITFYDRDFGTDFVIIKSKDWLKALNNAKEADQKRKEEWAAKQKLSAHVNAACEDCGDYYGDNCVPC